MSYNADYTREYFAIMESLQGDVPGRRAAYEYLQGSTAIVHHQVVAASFVPRLFDAGTYRIMKEMPRPPTASSSRSSSTTWRTPTTAAPSTSTRASRSSSACRAATTRCFRSHAWTRS